MKKSSSAAVLCAALGVLIAPACEIHFQKGETSGQTAPDPTSGAGAGTGGATSTLTPEQLTDLDGLQKADPNEVALITDTASFAAVTTNNLVGAQMVDPSTLDATTAAQLIDSVAPAAINAALAWSQSIDPSTLPTGIYPKNECIDPPRNCPFTIKCPNVPGNCYVTDCGKGSCSTCPEFLQSLLIKGWCAYGCMKGTEVTGGAFILQTTFPLDDEPYCFGK
jgi:hypothetical protein